MALVLLFGLLLVGTVASAGAYLYLTFGVYRPNEAPASVAVKNGERVNILVLGVDKEGDRSDTIIVLSLDPDAGRLGVMSIPRDTRVKIPGRGTSEKIAHANAYWDKDMSGTARSMKAVEELLGIPIHYFIRINFRGFERLIDFIGGVETDVPFDMYYHDPYQNLTINLRKGRQTLDGKKALQFVRYRSGNGGGQGYPDGDLGRIHTQQAFMRSVLRKMVSAGVLVRLPALIPEMARYIQTNIPPDRFPALAKAAATLGSDKVTWGVLPGTPGDLTGGYYLADERQTEIAVDRILRGRDRADDTAVKIEILNGSGVAGAAEHMADFLRDRDYQIIKVDNADRFDYRVTMILNHGAESDSLRDLVTAAKAKAPGAQLVSRTETRPGSPNVTIIVGNDYHP